MGVQPGKYNEARDGAKAIDYVAKSDSNTGPQELKLHNEGHEVNDQWTVSHTALTIVYIPGSFSGQRSSKVGSVSYFFILSTLSMNLLSRWMERCSPIVLREISHPQIQWYIKFLPFSLFLKLSSKKFPVLHQNSME